MKEYDVNGQDTQDPLSWNGQYRGYGLGSMIDDVAGTILFGDPEASSNMWAEISGYNSQQREFQQQEYLLEKQQLWNSENARMARMKAAGINPNTAAAGIAGSQSSSGAPSVSSATGAPAAAIGSAASMLGAIGSSRQAFAEASFKGATEKPTVQNIIADTEEKATQAGYNEAMSRNIAIANTYLPAEKALGLIALRKNLANMDAQRDLYIAQKSHYASLINEIDKHIEVMQAEQNLLEMQKSVEQKRGLLLDQQTFELKWQNDIRTLFKIDPLSPIENNAFLLWLNKSPLYEGTMNFLQNVNYKRFTGQYASQAEWSWYNRPTNLVESQQWIGHSLAKFIQDFIKSGKPEEFFDKIKSNTEASADFEDAYNDAYDELHDKYIEAKRECRKAKFSAATETYKAECRERRDKLEEELNSFNRAKYRDMLLSKLGNPADIPFEE